MDSKGFLRAVSIPFLLAGLLGCSQSNLIAPSPTPNPGSASLTGSPSVLCGGPLDTATTVGGVVSERTRKGIRPISGASVELFLRDPSESDEILDLDPVKETLTRADGRYFICLPPPAGGTGATVPGGQPFEVRVRKSGYRTASQSFRLAYSVWDYDLVEVNLELVRD